MNEPHFAGVPLSYLKGLHWDVQAAMLDGVISVQLSQRINDYYWEQKLKEKKNDSIHDTLQERGVRYGAFEDHARYAENLLLVLQSAPNWATMKPDAKQALRVITDKIARILNGDPDYDDNWRDISGYATLVLDRIIKQNA